MATTYTLNYTGSQLDSAIQQINTNTQNLSSHISNSSNPHNTTAAQVGAYVKPSTGIPETDLSEEVQAKLNSGGSAENLLKGDVTVTVADGSLNALNELGYPLGISAEKSYEVTIDYNGADKDIIIKSSDWQKNETAVGAVVGINDSVRILVFDGMSADYSINPNTSCLGIDRGDTSGSLSVVFKSITEYTEVIADKVKNPLKITVNGEEKTYDGSEAVEVDINTEGTNNLIRTTQSTTTGAVEGLSSNIANLNFALNLKIGSQYIIKYKHEGVIYEATAEAWNQRGMTVIGSFDTGSGHAPIYIIPDNKSLGVIFIADKVDLVTQQTGDVSSLAMIYLEGATLPTTPDEFISLVEIETTIETYKIQSVSISQGETMSSVVTKITSAIAQELTAYNKTSAIVSVVLNNLMIADAVSGGSSNNRAFIEAFYQTCSSRVTPNSMEFVTPFIRAYASDNELWGSGDWAVTVQFSKLDSTVLIQLGGGVIGSGGPSGFTDLSNFVSDNNTTIDLIFY